MLPSKTEQPGIHDAGATVLDTDTLRDLASVLGQQRTARMAVSFFEDAERRMALLDQDDATPAALQDHVHALISMAGHLGLSALSGLCITLQELARGGRGLDQRASLRAAIDMAYRAVDAFVQESGFVRRDADLAAHGIRSIGPVAPQPGPVLPVAAGRMIAPRPTDQRG